MNIETTTTIGQHAAAFPSSKRVFEKLGIDYCCGGNISLEDACQNHALELKHVVQMLAAEEGKGTGEGVTRVDYTAMSLAALSDHIVREHHVFTRDENARISALLEKVCSVHGENHPELHEINAIFAALRLELENHMLKEERMLFPYISLMESSVGFGLSIPPAPFGTTRNPVRVMISDHETAGEQLREIRRLSQDFAVPANACVTYAALYEALEGLEKDLHQHIHLENNILFPKAIEMEDAQALPEVRAARESICAQQGIH